MIPFEFHLCVFRKLCGSNPNLDKAGDTLLIGCIKRAIMDAFWSQASGTVQKNASRARLMIDSSESVGLSGPFVYRGELPWRDHCGYEVAVNILLHLRRSGKLDKEYVQFDSIRILRSTFSNFIGASPQANLTSLSLGDMKGHYQRFNIDEFDSFWFHPFMEGLKNRMGQVWLPNKAMSIC